MVPGRLSFPRSARITCAPDYRWVFQHGERKAGRYVVCHVAQRFDLPARLGLVVSRKAGRATVRNRIKRVVREYFRSNRHRLEPGTQVVVVARGGVLPAGGREYAEELEQLLKERLADE